MDRILISGLNCRCVIGVNDHERLEKQEVIIDIEISADLRKASMSDRFEDTVDYRALKKKVLAMTESSRFFLIEALANAVAEICMEYPMVSAARVRVEKPGALRFAKSVGVEIYRERA